MDQLDRPEWAQVQPDHASLEQEARCLVSAGAAGGLLVRVVGGVAIYHRLSPGTREHYARIRSVPHDIDLLAPPKTGNQVKNLFMSLGYVADERLIAWQGGSRHRYFHLDEQGQPKLEVDVFLGKPPLCHDMDFASRLDLPGPAMGATDLLLQKLQIHDATAKDLLDAAFLLAEFPLADSEDTLDIITTDRVAKPLAADWGFFHTATTNLARVETAAAELPEGLGGRAAERARELLNAVEAVPKGRRWKMRQKVGTRAQWYEDVEEVVR